MHDSADDNFNDYIAYNLRRAAEERGKAAETVSAHDRACRLQLADMFEARAHAAPMPFGQLSTLH